MYTILGWKYTSLSFLACFGSSQKRVERGVVVATGRFYVAEICQTLSVGSFLWFCEHFFRQPVLGSIPAESP